MMNKAFRVAVIPLAVCLGTLITGCTMDVSGDGDKAPKSGIEERTVHYMTFVSYYDDAAHTNLVGSATFSDCPGDPASRWGATTSFYEIVSDPCADGH
jgi:hypothetical protein